MSANHSDSDGSWSLLDEEERHSSSSDFVEVLQGSETVSYHHKDQAVTKATEDNLGQETEGESDKSAPPLPLSPEGDDTVNSADDGTSSIEELNLTELNTQPDSQDAPLVAAAVVESSVHRRLRKLRSASSLDSESEHSDFVRIESPLTDSAMKEEVCASPGSTPPPQAVMHISSGSSASASSISSSFRFISNVGPTPSSGPAPNPVLAQQEHGRRQLRGPRRWYRRGHSADDLEAYALHDSDTDGDVEESDVDAIPSDVDDRCESDISGVAVDYDDDDWVVAGDDGEIPLSEGNVHRSYRHHANSSLNSILTTLAIMALFLALGTGFGHFLGMQRDLNLRKQQGHKMRDLQDDYVLCLKQRDGYLKQISDPAFPNTKLNAITGVWKQKYEDLIVEKVELEERIQDLEQSLEDKTEIAQLQAVNHAEKMDQLQQQISGLKVQHSTSLIQAEMQLAQAKEEDKHQMNELDELTGRLAEQEERNRELLTSLESATSIGNLDQISSGRKMPRTDFKAREEELNKKQTELNRMKEELDAKEGEISMKEEELNKLKIEMRTKEKELQQKESKLSAVETMLQGQEKELSAHKAKLTAQEVHWKTELVKRQTGLVGVKKMELAELKRQVADAKQKFQEVTTALTERKAELATTSSSGLSVVDAQAFKEELNTLRHENYDLRKRLSTVLYQQPPKTPARLQPQVSMEDSILEESATSISESDASIIIPMPAAEDHQPDNLDIEIVIADEGKEQEMVSNLVEELHNARTQHQDAEERAQRCETAHKECKGNTPSSFMACLRLLLPNITAPEINTTEFMQRLLQDGSFGKILEEQWRELYLFLEQGRSADLPWKVKEGFRAMEKRIQKKWDEFVRFTREQKLPVEGKFAGDRFQTVVNKTKETVSQLSEKIHNTWHKVKNLSSNMLRSSDALGSIANKVVDKVDLVKNKVKHSLGKVRESVQQSGWFHKKKKTEENSRFDNHPQDHFGNSPYSQDQQEAVSHGEEFAKPKPDCHGFNSKADHKQTQSSSLHQQYKEFWKRANYDPDDYVAEDFFQGNQREWKKHQKRFKKLYGRIHRLNEDMFYSMDDDDIEDMYEDLDDFEDDVDVHEQPAKLKDWLTCQMRWWKSRFQRKKRNEDYVRGCTAQLMRWQLRAMCKPLCEGKKCQHHATTNMDACEALLTVIKPTAAPTCQPAVAQSIDNDTVVKDFSMEGGNAQKVFTGAVVDKNHQETGFVLVDVSKTPAPTTKDSANVDNDAEWVWNRYHAREYLRQEKPDWLFKRANRRAFEREKPWYFKRADQRNTKWAEKQDQY